MVLSVLVPCKDRFGVHFINDSMDLDPRDAIYRKVFESRVLNDLFDILDPSQGKVFVPRKLKRKLT